MEILNNFSYCLPNVTTHEVASECFQNTVMSSLPAGFIVTFGSVKLIKYWRYGTRIEDLTKIPTSKLYYLQIFLLTLLPSLSALNVFPNSHSFGYSLISTSLTCLSFFISILLLQKERFYLIPSNHKRGHGIVQLIFWSSLFIIETISLITLKNDQWRSFLPRYVCSFLVLILGIFAPGIETKPNDDNTQLKDDKGKDESTFAWGDAGTKLRLLLRFVWPKNNFEIQLKLFFCVLLLAFERLTNLLVPIYNQKIGEFIKNLCIALHYNHNFQFIFFFIFQLIALEKKYFAGI